MVGPEAVFDEAIGGGHFPKDVEEEPHRKIGHVGGEDVAGIGDGNAAAAALGKIDVVEAGAGSDDEAQRGQISEDGGGERENAAGEGGSSGVGMSG